MERKFLKDFGLENEIIDKILDQNSAEIGKHKAAFETAQARLGTLEQDIAQRDADLATLKAVDAQGLQGKLDALQKQYDAALADRDAQDTKRTHDARRDAFFSGVAFTGDYAKRGVLAEFDEKGFPFNEADNTFAGAKEWLEQLQAASPAAFGAQAAAPAVVRETQSAPSTAITKEGFAKMGYRERVALKTNDPTLYQSLKE